jgi:hypothetical protein
MIAGKLNDLMYERIKCSDASIDAAYGFFGSGVSAEESLTFTVA